VVRFRPSDRARTANDVFASRDAGSMPKMLS